MVHVQWRNRKKTYKLDFPLSSVIREVYLFFEQTKKRKNSVQPSKPVYTAPATLWLWPLGCFGSWWNGWNIAKGTSSPCIFLICARTLLHVRILMQMVLTNWPNWISRISRWPDRIFWYTLTHLSIAALQQQAFHKMSTFQYFQISPPKCCCCQVGRADSFLDSLNFW